MIDKMAEAMNKAAEKLLPTAQFNEDFREHVKLAKSSVVDGKVKSFMPRLVLSFINEENPKERGLAIIGLGEFPDTNEEKRKVMSMLGLACAANDLKVVMTVFETEAWTAQETRDPATIPDKEWVRPSERPDRKEIILVAARSIDGRDAFASIPITGREADESLILGKETVQEFAEKRDGSIKDSLLSEFFQFMAAGSLAKLQVDSMLAEGKEVPKELQNLILAMDNCPIKLRKQPE